MKYLKKTWSFVILLLSISMFSSLILINNVSAESFSKFNTGRLKSINKCIALKDTNHNNGNLLQVGDCPFYQINDLNRSPDWSYDINTKQIRLEEDRGKCLDLFGAIIKPETQIDLWDCHPGTSQEWLVMDSGLIRLKADPSYCLDIYGNNPTNGTKIQLWPCSGNSNQLWQFIGSKVQGQNRYCMDAFSGDLKNRDELQIWSCNGGANQQWIYNRNTRELKTPNGKCVDALDNVTDNGAHVGLWDCNGKDNQKWTLDFNYNRIIGVQSNRCLDEFSGTGYQGNRIDLWTCSTGSNQKWTWDSN
jgi:hypothetical protein